MRCFFWATMVLVAAQSAIAQVQPAHTALWQSDTRTGEGWLLEILSEELAVMYWFTYDEQGNQRWLVDVGNISGSTITFPELSVTRGGQLGRTDADNVKSEVVGHALMTFDDCDSGTFEYSAFDHSETIDITPLTVTSGAYCGNSQDASPHPNAALTGSWYDPEHSGEGFILQWMSRGGAVLIWFTYDSEGGQKWIIGTGESVDGYIYFEDMNATYGARFGQKFDPDDVVQEPWGELRLLLNPDSGRVEYFPLDDEYDAGEMELKPLTDPDWIGSWWRPLETRGTEEFDITAFSIRGHRGTTLDTTATESFYLDWETTDGDDLATDQYHLEAWFVSAGGENVWQKRKILERNCPAFPFESGCDLGENSFPCRFERNGEKVSVRCPPDETFSIRRVDRFFGDSIGLPGRYFIQIEGCGYVPDTNYPYLPIEVCGSRSAPVRIE